MTESILDLVGRKLLQFPWAAKSVTIAWHAGEPLALGTSYYENAFIKLQQTAASNLKLHHAMQTNGMLINDQWIDLFRRWNVHVGLSIDGPPHLHDAMRVDRAGRGTSADTYRGLTKMVSAGLPVNVITVLTDASLDYPDELFSFYVDHGVTSVGFNVEEIEGVHRTSSLAHPGSSERVYRFLERFWDLMEANPGRLISREWEGVVSSILDSSQADPFNPLAEPLALIWVDVDGNMGTFDPELLDVQDKRWGSFHFGNLRNGGPELFAMNPRVSAISREIADGISTCRKTCPWFNLCGGGSPVNKLFETGRFDTDETLHCRLTRQIPLELALRRLERQSTPYLE
jgi:uncharacterized protein